MAPSSSDSRAVEDDGLRDWLRSRTGNEPTEEDLRECRQNIVGFFEVMREWHREDLRKAEMQKEEQQ